MKFLTSAVKSPRVTALSAVVIVFTIFLGWTALTLITAPSQASILAAHPAGVLPHGIITISADADFTEENGVVKGTGTPDDPYEISGWRIDAAGGDWCINVTGTTKTFIIKNCSLINANNFTRTTHFGVGIYGAANVSIQDNVFVNCIESINLNYVTNGTISSNWCSGIGSIEDYYGEGIIIAKNVSNLGITDNLCEGNFRAIAVEWGENLTIANNLCRWQIYSNGGFGYYDYSVKIRSIALLGCNNSEVVNNEFAPCKGFLGSELSLVEIIGGSGNSEHNNSITQDDSFVWIWLTFLIAYPISISLAIFWVVRNRRRRENPLELHTLLVNKRNLILAESLILLVFPLEYYTQRGLLSGVFNISPIGIEFNPEMWAYLVFAILIITVAILVEIITSKKANTTIAQEIPKNLQGWQVNALTGQFYRWTLFPLVVMLVPMVLEGLFSYGNFIPPSNIIPSIYVFLLPLFIFHGWLCAQGKRVFQQVCFAMLPQEQRAVQDIERDMAKWGAGSAQNVLTPEAIESSGAQSVSPENFQGTAITPTRSNQKTKMNKIFSRTLIAFIVIVVAFLLLPIRFPTTGNDYVIALLYTIPSTDFYSSVFPSGSRIPDVIVPIICLALTTLLITKFRGSIAKERPKGMDVWNVKAISRSYSPWLFIPLLILIAAAIPFWVSFSQGFPIHPVILIPLWALYLWLIYYGKQQFQVVCEEMQPAARSTAQTTTRLNREFVEWVKGGMGGSAKSHDRRITCEICGKGFQTKATLQLHKQTEHSSEILPRLIPMTLGNILISGLVSISALVFALFPPEGNILFVMVPSIFILIIIMVGIIKYGKARTGITPFGSIRKNIFANILIEIAILLVLPIISSTNPISLYGMGIDINDYIFYLTNYGTEAVSLYLILFFVVFAFCVVALLVGSIFPRRSRNILALEVPSSLETWDVESLVVSDYRRNLLPTIILVGAWIPSCVKGIFRFGTYFFNGKGLFVSLIFLVPLLIYNRWLCVQGKNKFRQLCLAMHSSAQAEPATEFVTTMDQESKGWSESGKKKQDAPISANMILCKICGKAVNTAAVLWEHTRTDHAKRGKK